MQRTTKQLTYVEVSGATVTPGSILTYTGGGSVIMNAVPTGLLLDPSGAITIESMVTAYNSLVWGLYQSGMIITEPRVWFGKAGETGVLLSRVGAPVAMPYVPYSGASGAYSYISMNDALAALNGLLGDISGAQFRYADGRVSLIVQDGITIRFDEAPTVYGSTRRMLNRLFLRDISGYIGVDLSGPLMIQGEPIAAPTYGVFPEPAPASNIRISNQTSDSFDLSWNASPTPDVLYYVQVTGTTFDNIFVVSSTTLSLGTAQGIVSGVNYVVVVTTTTPYEVSTIGNPTIDTRFFGPISRGINRDATITTGHIRNNVFRQYGYRIPIGSTFIGRRFNKILFPMLVGGGLLSSLIQNTVGTGTTPSKLYVNIHQGDPYNGGTLISSEVIDIEGTSTFNNPYEIVLPNTITISENMHIIFSSPEGVVCMGYDNVTAALPLEPIIVSTLLNTITPTNIGMLCEFDLI